MKAEKMHKHLEPDLGPSPAAIPSAALTPQGMRCTSPDPPRRAGRVSMGQGGHAGCH